MADSEAAGEPLEGIRDSLLRWRKYGVVNPLIPFYDASAESAVFYGLDEGDAVAVVYGMSVKDSVSVSTGRGLEGGARDAALRHS